MLRLLFAFASILIASFAHAGGDNTVRDFKAAARQIPNNLLRQGYDQIGRLHLAQFLRDMEGVKVSSTGFFYRKENDSSGMDWGRSTARWKRKGRDSFIEVNAELWAKVPTQVKSVIGLHEYLGVAGFNDHNYNLSMALWLLSLSETTRNFTNEEKKWLVSGAVAEARSGGGITGVGGGGDWAGVSTRMSVLRRNVKKLAGTSGNERNEIFRKLSQIFNSRKEVKRTGSNDITGSMQSAPSEIASEMHLMDLCQEYLEFPKSSQVFIYKKVAASYPVAAKKFRNVAGMVKYCRNMVAAGDLSGKN